MIDKLEEDKQFIEIINTGTDKKPYYEIRYLDRVTGITHIGYSSYKLDVLSEFLREDFGYDRHKGHWQKYNELSKLSTEDVVICDKCAFVTYKYTYYKFCPNCGARMERSDKE